jgi:hypothetical protein
MKRRHFIRDLRSHSLHAAAFERRVPNVVRATAGSDGAVGGQTTHTDLFFFAGALSNMPYRKGT